MKYQRGINKLKSYKGYNLLKHGKINTHSYVCVCVPGCSVVSNSAIPWTIAHQAPLSMGFPRQEYWSGSPFPSPEDLPDSEIESASLASPVLAGGFFTNVSPGKPKVHSCTNINKLELP